MSHPLPIYPQAVLLYLGRESLAVDTQNAGSFLPSTLGPAQNKLDISLLKFLETEALI